MPIHDWTRVDPGVFHHFHHSWIEEIARALNGGLLPAPYYALAEQIVGGLGPDVLALQGPKINGASGGETSGGCVLQLDVAAPKVRFRVKSERDEYARKANVVRIRHRSGHEVVAVVEVVSPGNKSNRHGLHSFVAKAVELLEAGIHLLVVDMFPRGPRDPHGIHEVIWKEFSDAEVAPLPAADRPLTLASYRAGSVPEAFVEPTALGMTLIDMPVFLTADEYVLLPLEASYLAAWKALPALWRNTVEGQ